MTKQEKQLLLVDLCARLPYGVIILHSGWNYEWDDSISTWERVVGIDETSIYTKVIDSHTMEEYREDSHSISLFDDKPYLRPMSSMTEEEEREVRILWNEDFVGDNNWYHYYPKTTDFYLSHHLDFRNLIQKGLALEAPEGMYKTD